MMAEGTPREDTHDESLALRHKLFDAYGHDVDLLALVAPLELPDTPGEAISTAT